MPQGYLVTLGNNSLDSGDVISGALINFDTSRNLGAGNWVWSGTAGGTTYTNTSEPGVYFLATNGNVYFVPDFGPVTTITSAQATTVPNYIVSDGTVSGTAGDDVIDENYSDDPEDDAASSTADTIVAGAGNDTVFAAEGEDSIDGGTGNDTINAGDNNDTIIGGIGDDSISGDAGDDSISGGAGNDIIRGDTITSPDRIAWEWSKMPDPDDASQIDEDDALVNGTQQIIGGVGITYSYRANPAGTTDGTGGSDTAPIFNAEATSTAGINDGLKTANSNSSAHFGGDLATNEIELAFDRAVTNVSFNINDIDSNGVFTDRASVFAFDAAGNPIAVTVVFGGQLTQSNSDGVAGNETGTAIVNDATSGLDAGNTMNVSIAGPVARLVVRYEDTQQTGDDGLIEVTDVYFDEPFDPAGNDNIDGGAGDDIVFGDDGNDTLQGGTGADSLYGGAGNDRIDDSGSDADYIEGGDGDDSVTAGTGADTIFGGAGNDNLRGEGNDDRIFGGDGNDTVDGDGGADTLFGDAGNDRLIGDGGNDSLYGGIGNDTAFGGSGADSIFGGDGDDSALGGIGNDSISGGSGNDSLAGQDGDDRIAGGTGNDYLDGDGGNDSISGDAGDDTLVGDAGNDSLYGGAGNDQIFASSGNNTAEGGAGNDSIFMGTGRDTINGGTGNDSMVGGGDDDVIVLTDVFGIDNIDGSEDVGDTDVDILDASALTGDVTVDLSTLSPADNERGTLTDGANTATFNNIENIRLGAGDDSVTGSSGNDTVELGTGADTVNAGAGDDVIDLGNGSPDGDADVIVLQDGFGNDVIDSFDAPTPAAGGLFNGIDTLDVSNLFDLPPGDPNRTPVLTNDVTVTDDGSGNAVLTFPNGESITLNGISPADADNPFYLNAIGIPMPDGTVSGTAGDDLIDGNYLGDPDGDIVDNDDAILPGDTANDDLIFGFAGDDSILAGDGNDEVYGGADNDTIDAGTGDDTVFGGTGNDVVLGSGGDDNLFGGVGDDTFQIDQNSDSDTITGGENIGDFDTVDFSGTDGGQGVVVSYTGDEAAGYIVGTSGADGNFSEIEGVIGSQYDDVINANADSVGASIIAGDGNDTITGGSGNDSVTGDAGNDTITGGEGDDTLDGGDDADEFVLSGTFGDDTITGGEGGTDSDTINLTNPADSTTILTGDEAGTITDGTSTATFSEIEVLDLDAGNDTVDASASDAPITIFGNAGNDDITGSTADDSLFGGADSDTLAGGEGADLVDGGAGDDTIRIADDFGNDAIIGGETGETNGDTLDGSALTQDVTVNFSGPEAGTVDNGTDTATFAEIEQVETGSGDDTITGGSGNEDVITGAGDDIVTTTGTGADTIATGAGNDTVTFSEGDSIGGGSGDDTFILEDLGEPTNGAITITGGQGGETPDDGDPLTLEGDTLQLGTLADLSTLVKTSDGINADGNETFSGSVTLDDGTLLTFSEIENIICFTPGTLIATPHGARDIATLKVGDMVVTRDHGLQPIRWIQSRTVPAQDRFAPVRIRPGVVTGLEREILVSPQHRMLFQGYRAELLFGESEVLIAAKHLIDGKDVTQDAGGDVTYIHMMFDEHEIVFAEGCASESFHPGSVGLSAVSDPAREELFALFPDLRSDPNGYGPTARRCLKRHEAELVR
ncbi:Hint domain-containing protein [Yoonia sp. 208BN28-4]|uniref:Hint domain-containing protein n=1 Tax=Yoonia sp. 208BN28-4 TaxID=3126505 RepID=UPI0030A24D77